MEWTNRCRVGDLTIGKKLGGRENLQTREFRRGALAKQKSASTVLISRKNKTEGRGGGGAREGVDMTERGDEGQERRELLRKGRREGGLESKWRWAHRHRGGGQILDQKTPPRDAISDSGDKEPWTKSKIRNKSEKAETSPRRW